MNDRMNTVFGWVLFSGIVALGLAILSGKYFHAERPEQMGMVVEGVVTDGPVDTGPDFGSLLANADVTAGQRSFAKCVACHTVDEGGANGIGPNLYGIMGKPIGSHVAGFAYSSALAGKGGDWTWEAMDEWLKSPRGFANGTKMSFAGLGIAEERANVMEYLAANGGAPAKPAPVVAEEVDAEAGEEAVAAAAEETAEAGA
ncbi:MAG TPA: cytochrome c family protein [Erythrobacter sp.]|nr:cytochrome c family protein [Erythrobacter sp.]